MYMLVRHKMKVFPSVPSLTWLWEWERETLKPDSLLPSNNGHSDRPSAGVPLETAQADPNRTLRQQHSTQGRQMTAPS